MLISPGRLCQALLRKHLLEVPRICLNFLPSHSHLQWQHHPLGPKAGEQGLAVLFQVFFPPAQGLCVSPLLLRKRQCSTVLPTEMLMVLEWALSLTAIKSSS